ncbi:MAG: 3-oxoacyl-ACP synthase, partial [Thermodesulfobacteriota bacterium]
MIRSRIAGTGSAVPKKVLANADIEKLVDTSDDWIRTRTGIAERRVVVDESSVGLASDAGKRALSAAGIKADEIDLVIVG